ncbi:MAG: carbohydrate kinase family protein [Spirochaetaceae bacterium]|nr:carbohydrate kinase family protein [Spirochaetaceae bacterium]
MTVFVAGGLNEDIKARPLTTFTPRSSNSGRVYRAPGGVGRNIAHSLALLGAQTTFCSAAGNDSGGDSVLSATAAAGVDTSAVFRFDSLPTGTYLAIQDETGDLSSAISDMEIMDTLQVELLRPLEPQIASAAALVLDTNLRTTTLAYLAHTARRHGVPCIAEPVSVQKSTRLASILQYCTWISPNLDELCALYSIEIFYMRRFLRSLVARPGQSTALAGDITAALESASSGTAAPQLLITLGAEGVLLLSRDPQCSRRHSLSLNPSEDPLSGNSLSASSQWWAWWYPPLPARPVDTNGAGDAFIAGFTAAFTAQASAAVVSPASAAAAPSVADAVQWGQAAAAITLESQHTVAPELSRTAILERLAQ